VANVSINPDGKFGFVELKTEELATLAMNLDKVDLCGRQINVGRPRGYVDPVHGGMPSGAPAPGGGGGGMGGGMGGMMGGMGGMGGMNPMAGGAPVRLTPSSLQIQSTGREGHTQGLQSGRLRFEWVQLLKHATAQMNHTPAHQAAFHQHAIGLPYRTL